MKIIIPSFERITIYVMRLRPQKSDFSILRNANRPLRFTLSVRTFSRTFWPLLKLCTWQSSLHISSLSSSILLGVTHVVAELWTWRWRAITGRFLSVPSLLLRHLLHQLLLQPPYLLLPLASYIRTHDKRCLVLSLQGKDFISQQLSWSEIID